jgi:hypothetical protein
LQLEPRHHFHGDVVSATLEARDAREALASGTASSTFLMTTTGMTF